MKFIEPYVEIEEIDGIALLKKIEKAGRTCYQSEARITSDSYIRFIKGIIARGHLSVIEHVVVTAKVVCDRGVSHEIVRHRIASYSQESTRYVNYKEGIEVIQPPYIIDQVALAKWEASMLHAENTYKDLISLKVAPEIARSVLPTALATELIMTMNLREWRHFLTIRRSKGAHPQIAQIANMLLIKLQKAIPVIFEDL
jgi:thymidylate synthase (FAD)